MKKLKVLIVVVFIFYSCREEKIIMGNNKDKLSLQTYISNNSDKQISKNLIACAASTHPVSRIWEWIDTSSSLPVSILLLPINSATNFKYFEMNNDYHPQEDFTNYFESDNKSLPILSGLLRLFWQKSYPEDFWSRVTFLTDDSLHICNAIRVKHYSNPTIVANNVIELTYPEPNKPLFSWESDTNKENVIYFQVISTSDKKDSVISATYTYKKYFQFYDLSNVILNVHDITPAPELKRNVQYKFILMGVSEDNWVNLIATKYFIIFNE